MTLFTLLLRVDYFLWFAHALLDGAIECQSRLNFQSVNFCNEGNFFIKTLVLGGVGFIGSDVIPAI